MYYALSDRFTKNNPDEYTHGFANTKIVICFKTKKERASWLDSTKLLTAKPLTRDEARAYASIEQSWCGHYKVRLAKIYGTDEYHAITKEISY